MFRQKNEEVDAPPVPLEAAAQPVPRFDHPQVLLLDIDAASETALRAAGFNISTGSFGVPYKIFAQDGMQRVVENGHLPVDYTEQEIVIADLVPRTLIDQERERTPVSPRQNGWWARTDTGVIDPRPGFMSAFTGDFDRTFDHGGVFIIFADARHHEKRFIFGHLGRNVFGHDEFVPQDVYCDNWSVLSLLSPYHLKAPYTTGRDIRLIETTDIRFIDQLSRAIADHLVEASFTYTLQPASVSLKERWIPLATNRFGEAVAALIVPGQDTGLVLLLPDLDDRPRLLKRLLTDVLPEIVPQLFPHVERGRWVEHPEYELPGVLEVRRRIRQVEEEARAQVTELEERIMATRHELGYLHDLLTEQGRPLVEAVKRTLATLGFQNVVDVDAEMAVEGKPELNEDLRIEDGSPLVLVEVKGVHGTVADNDALQILKHLRPRTRQLDRADINGLSIINHQRPLPALQRSSSPFNATVVTTAQDQGVGLMTTWDLHRLTRSFLRNGWKHEDIEGLFSQTGRILPIPKHYMPVGIVEKTWEKASAVSIHLTDVELAIGDRIAFDLPIVFEEQAVDSLQVDRVPVEQAPVGALVGVKTGLSKDQIKVGTRVYKVTVTDCRPVLPIASHDEEAEDEGDV